MLREIFSANPLLIDFRRSVRRFFGLGKQGKLSLAVATISGLVYGLILLIAWTSREYISPIAYVICMNVILCLVVPAAVHGAIAGERERRSWDFLMVAPISNTQIVAGKFMSGVGLIGLISILFVPMLGISYFSNPDATLGKLVGVLAVSLSYSVCLSAFSLFISSRSKRAFAANLSIYALQFIGLIMYPMIVMLLSQGQSETWAFFLHPFVVDAAIWQGETTYNTDNILLMGGGLIQTFSFCLIALALLGWTEATLRDLDKRESGG